MAKGTNSKKHHYVPQSILKNFSIEAKGKQIFVFDKKQERIFPSSIQNAGSENYFNTVKTPFGELNLETLFQNCDGIAASISKKITDTESLARFRHNDYYSLALTVAIQLHRTKLVRTTLDYVSKEQEKMVRELCGTSDKFEFSERKNKALSANEIKLISVLGAFNVDGVLKNLLSRGIYLVRNSTDFPFWISDNPVVIHNSFPYGYNGINHKGTEVIFPISPKMAIVFSCKSILHMFEIKEKLGVLDEFDKAYLKAVRDKITLEILHENVEQIEFYNQQQVLNSSRFIYGNKSKFSLAQETIDAIPKSKEIKSKIKVGEMGKGPPPNPNLPNGELLVIYGRRGHYMMPIEIVSNDVDIEFTAPPSLGFKMILDDAPYQRVEVYVDRHMRRLIGEPKIVPVDLNKGIFKLYNEFNSVIKQLRKEKKPR